MTVNEIKKQVAAALDRERIGYTRLSGRTVGFSDLARGSAAVIKVHGINYADLPRLKSIKVPGALIESADVVGIPAGVTLCC